MYFITFTMSLKISDTSFYYPCNSKLVNYSFDIFRVLRCDAYLYIWLYFSVFLA